jgi:alkylhydroperoxidase family enzyme
VSYPDPQALPTEISGMLREVPQQPPVEMLAHSPALVRPFLQTGQALLSGLRLPIRSREVIILTVAALIDCEYEYVQHRPISEAAELSVQEREALHRKDFDADILTAGDRVLVRFVTELLQRPRVSDALFDELRNVISVPEIVEVHHVVGFYWSLGRLCTNLDIEITQPDGLDSLNAVLGLNRD